MTMPWMVLGLTASTLGWAQEEYAYASTGAVTELDGAGPNRAPLRRQTTTTGEKTEKTLVLTFDDGPSEFTPDVLRVLSKYGLPATFFVLGERAAEMPDVVRAITDAGHGLDVEQQRSRPFRSLFDCPLVAGP